MGASQPNGDNAQGKALTMLKSSNAPVVYPKYTGLLHDADDMIILESKFSPLANGMAPTERPIKEYISSGVINLDKPANPSSHEVVAWVKKVLNVEKTGHSGTLDPKVTGTLIVCIDRATRLVKSQQGAGKEYVCVLRLHGKFDGGRPRLEKALEELSGAMFQRPPVVSAVKRQLRVRTAYGVDLLEFDEERNLAVFWVNCEAGTYIRTMCVHLGLWLGCGGHMQELRRIRSGALSEADSSRVTLHDVLDAKWLHRLGNEKLLRHVVQPLETLLMGHKRMIIKDTAIDAVCHGAQLTRCGVLRLDKDIKFADEVVAVSAKGEAIALMYSAVSVSTIAIADHGVIARTKRVIMERNTYAKCWGKGSFSAVKRLGKETGQLDKHGMPHENTHPHVKEFFDKLMNKQVIEDPEVAFQQAIMDDRTSRSQPQRAPIAQPASDAPAVQASVNGEKATKKRAHDEDGSAEQAVADKEAKKARKAEKKEKKRRASTSKADDTDEV